MDRIYLDDDTHFYKREKREWDCVGNRISGDHTLFEPDILADIYDNSGHYHLEIDDEVQLTEEYYSLPAGLVGYVDEPGDCISPDPIINFPIYDSASNQLLAITTKGVVIDYLVMTKKHNELTGELTEMYVDIAQQAKDRVSEMKRRSDQIINDYLVATNDQVKSIKVGRDNVLYTFS